MSHTICFSLYLLMGRQLLLVQGNCKSLSGCVFIFLNSFLGVEWLGRVAGMLHFNFIIIIIFPETRSFFCFCFCFETGSHYAVQAGLGFTL